MSKELTPLEHLEFIRNYEIDDEHRTLDMNYACKQSLDIIETTLKNYEELTSKPVILCGRTHGYTCSLIDRICKNYKEIKITNLEDEKKIKALEIIKERKVNLEYIKCCDTYEQYCLICSYANEITEEHFGLLKEMLQ